MLRELAFISTKIHAIVAFSVIGQGQALKTQCNRLTVSQMSKWV